MPFVTCECREINSSLRFGSGRLTAGHIALSCSVLHYYGGVYMDLDIGCKRRLDPLLQGDWDVILPRTKPVSSGRAERPSIGTGHRGLSQLMHSIGRSLE
jgi:hypothetical protein